MDTTNPQQEDNNNNNNNTINNLGTTPTKPKKVPRKYEYETITVREGGRPTPSSKYDFVKVKVWLEDHYYILSRFLVSRVLNVTKVCHLFFFYFNFQSRYIFNHYFSILKIEIKTNE